MSEKTDTPTYRGQPPHQGRLIPGELYPGEGYAVLTCGDTEVVLGYTLLHQLRFAIAAESARFAEVAAAQRALDAITCEASLGHCPAEHLCDGCGWPPGTHHPDCPI